MIAFWDDVSRTRNIGLRGHIKPDGVRQGIVPIIHGGPVPTGLIKTQGLE
jgi:hypothetical protein